MFVVLQIKTLKQVIGDDYQGVSIFYNMIQHTRKRKKYSTNVGHVYGSALCSQEIHFVIFTKNSYFKNGLTNLIELLYFATKGHLKTNTISYLRLFNNDGHTTFFRAF